MDHLASPCSLQVHHLLCWKLLYKLYLFHWPCLKLTRRLPVLPCLRHRQHCSHSAHREGYSRAGPPRLWLQPENMLLSSLGLWWACASPLLETEPLSNFALRGVLLNPDLTCGVYQDIDPVQPGLLLSGQIVFSDLPFHSPSCVLCVASLCMH